MSRTRRRKLAAGGTARDEPVRRTLSRDLRGAFDAAKSSPLDRNHWLEADHLSADDAANPEVRKTLRERARYEIANNSIARGISLTLANDVIGTGPRLQLLTRDAGLNSHIEDAFARWAAATDFAAKLRTMKLARVQDGEAFALLLRAPLEGTPVGLDMQLVEADQVAAPLGLFDDPRNKDGVILGPHGRPVKYQVLVEHPGSSASFDLDYISYDARHVLHLFRADRPGQHRGVPEITPAIPLFAQLRRYTLAVLSAAESAADWAGVIYTDCPAGNEADDVKAMDAVQLRRNSLLTMPAGWKIGQLDPKQPASTYAEFKHEILNEIARCLNMPFNVAAANSADYNYASGRLDHQTYFKAIRVDQRYIEIAALDRVLLAWLEMFFATDDGLDAADLVRGNTGRLPPHRWFWDGAEHVDPLKEANAAAVRLAYGIGNIPAELARSGADWETSMNAAAKALGVPLAEYQALVRQKTFGAWALPVADDERENSAPEEDNSHAR